MFFVALGCCIFFRQCDASEVVTDSVKPLKIESTLEIEAKRIYSEYLRRSYIQNQSDRASMIQSEVRELLPNITIPEHAKHLKQILEEIKDILRELQTIALINRLVNLSSDDEAFTYPNKIDKKILSFRYSIINYKEQELLKIREEKSVYHPSNKAPVHLNQNDDATYLVAGVLTLAGIAALLAIITSNEKEKEEDKAVVVYH